MAGSPFLNRLGYGYAAFVAIAPSDTVNQATPVSALICAVGGTVSLVDAQGNVASLTLAASVIYDLPTVVRVNATGTTATGLVGLA